MYIPWPDSVSLKEILLSFLIQQETFHFRPAHKNLMSIPKKIKQRKMLFRIDPRFEWPVMRKLILIFPFFSYWFIIKKRLKSNRESKQSPAIETIIESNHSNDNSNNNNFNDVQSIIPETGQSPWGISSTSFWLCLQMFLEHRKCLIVVPCLFWFVCISVKKKLQIKSWFKLENL